MSLRYSADWRTLLWACGFTPGLVGLQYARPELVPYLWWVSCYFALACGVIAHNHNHCPTFTGKWANEVFSGWLSVFYGYPTFAWIPTHNLNHHKFVNGPGDATITWRYTRRHVAWMAVVYFFVSSYWQAGPTKAFIAKARAHHPKLYRRIQLQYAVWVGGNLALLATAVALHGLQRGAFVFLMVSAVPSVFSLWTIMLFNYEQHVHADPWSRYNHSRSWDGRLLNFLLFNNGFHAAHHQNAGLHWTQLPALHQKMVAHIDPRLVEHSLIWYFVKQYLLAPFFPRFGSVQVGRAAWDPPEGQPLDLTSGDVEAVEAGHNAPMVSA